MKNVNQPTSPYTSLLLSGKNVTIINTEDYKELSKYKWYVNTRGYVISSIKINGKYKGVTLSRFIMNPTGKKQVDHINGNKLDNRRENLRICEKAQNLMNKKIYRNNTSGYKGVTFRKINSEWQAQLMVNKKQLYLGSFINIIDAASAYNNSALKYFGEFASLNII